MSTTKTHITSTKLRSRLIHEITEKRVGSNVMELALENSSYTNGFGFFPYGSGLEATGVDEIPSGGIMVVGQDFGTVGYVKQPRFKEAGEMQHSTIRNFKKLLGHHMHECFFTNLFMGLRKEASMIGANPGLKAKEEKYLDFCYDFLKKQIELVNPRAIIVLGRVPFQFIRSKQGTVNAFKNFNDYFKKQDVDIFGGVSMICLLHPSMWNSNLKGNKDAMLALVEKVIETS